MAVVRDLFLCLLFVGGVIAVAAPYLGTALPVFTATLTPGKSVDMPASVALYAVCFAVSVIAFVLRVLPGAAGTAAPSETPDAG